MRLARLRGAMAAAGCDAVVVTHLPNVRWLTGFSQGELETHLAERTTFEDFFAKARLNPARSQIKGMICGYRVEDIEEPLMRELRYLDKLIDELAKGKAMEKIKRG